MRALTVLSGVLAVVALVLSAMAFLHGGESRATCETLKDDIDKLDERVGNLQTDFSNEMQSEIGASRAGSEVRIAGIEARLAELEKNMPSGAAVKAGVQDALKAVSQQYMGIKKTVDDTEETAKDLDFRLSPLEQHVRELDAYLKKLEAECDLLRRLVANPPQE